MSHGEIRHDWTHEQVQALFDKPFLALVDQARDIHRRHQDPTVVQLATLANIKRGGCSEDCSYCPQSARFQTSVEREPLLTVERVLAQARRAKQAGASRFCMGAAWRKVRDGKQFDRIVEMVRGVRDLHMEACVTLGMLQPHQIERLADAGLTAYNHNLDTSREHYSKIISTRTYDDRLRTLSHVQDAGVRVCSGGIVGLGEEVRDRAELLRTLATMRPHPESVPINKLVRAPGTPLEDAPEIDDLDYLRTIAVARITMPSAMVRLAAGRRSLSRASRILAFQCGANSIFYGDELLTTPNPGADEDRQLMEELGLRPMKARIQHRRLAHT